MRTTIGFAILLCGAHCVAVAASTPQSIRKSLPQPTVIQGFPCAKGYAWFFADGQLEKCTVTHEMPFGEATIPAGSWITLTEDGKPRFVQMLHDAPILGLTCLGGSWLGPSEGPTVSFYPSGKLKQCFLTADHTVHGVPCMKSGGIFGNRSVSGPMFYENGRLKSCTLTTDFGTQHRGELFKQAP
jgi:hypothetical protein